MLSSKKVDDIFREIMREEEQDSISIIHFMSTIKNIVMIVSPKETKQYYKELRKVQHKPGGAINPPIPRHLQDMYDYLGINYEPSKRVYYLGKAKKKGHGKPLAYNQLPVIAKKARNFLHSKFNI